MPDSRIPPRSHQLMVLSDSNFTRIKKRPNALREANRSTPQQSWLRSRQIGSLWIRGRWRTVDSCRLSVGGVAEEGRVLASSPPQLSKPPQRLAARPCGLTALGVRNCALFRKAAS